MKNHSHIFIQSLLAFADSIYGTTVCTSAAIDAAVSVDVVLAVAFCDSANGTTVCTCAAGDAIFTNYVCHASNSPFFIL